MTLSKGSKTVSITLHYIISQWNLSTVWIHEENQLSLPDKVTLLMVFMAIFFTQTQVKLGPLLPNSTGTQLYKNYFDYLPSGHYHFMGRLHRLYIYGILGKHLKWSGHTLRSLWLALGSLVHILTILSELLITLISNISLQPTQTLWDEII